MGVEEDLLLLVAAALVFAAGVIGTQRLFRWFVVPGRWRSPGLTEPS
jgi:hypothetical protein